MENNTQKKILVVEDEKPLAKALELKLRNSGFEVETADDGEEVLSRMIIGQYDLVLLDLVMPKKDGFTVLAEVQKKGLKTPIIVTTNLSQPGDEEKARNLGAVGYIIKSNTRIIGVIEQVKTFLGIS